jgi:hypothetical protein
MTIHHRLNLSAEIAGPLVVSLGLPISPKPNAPNNRIVIQDVSEEDPLWPSLEALLAEYNRAWVTHPDNAPIVARYASSQDPLADFAGARFTLDERRTAPYLALDAIVKGFPVSTNALQFYRTTFKVSCPVCRHGAEQVAPLLLKGEPQWEKEEGIFQLNWLPDEFLVRLEMFDQVFRPHGIAARPLLDYNSRLALKSVVQLEISQSAAVDVSGIPHRACTACGEPIYERNARDFAPTPLSFPGPIFKSDQWFSPFHSIVYVSQQLFRSIEASGFRGAGFIPTRQN